MKNIKVSDVMTRDVVSVKPIDSLQGMVYQCDLVTFATTNKCGAILIFWSLEGDSQCILGSQKSYSGGNTTCFLFQYN